MSAQDLVSLLPMMILAGGILLSMILIALKRSHITTFVATLAILIAALISILYVKNITPHVIGDLFIVDRFGLYFQALILLSASVIVILSYISLRNFYTDKRKEEYYLLIMLASLGTAMMVIGSHFISFFVSIELLTISLYSLSSYYRDREKAIEAGIKYLNLAAMSSAFLLFGIALIYTVSGTLSFSMLANVDFSMNTSDTVMLLGGVGLIISGICFKLGVVPFHMWAPDVYEGASSPVSAFIATISKGGVVALLFRFFLLADIYRYKNVMLVFTIIAVLSMLIGNLLGLFQNNVKRLLAYSSIANLGYILVAFIAGKGTGLQAATFYLTAYTITILGAFGVITLTSQSDDEATDIENYKGLFWKKPILATAFTIFLLSLAGIPLTAGFMGKYFLLASGIAQEKWVLAFVLVISSVIGLYYYLRLIVVMISPREDTKILPKVMTSGEILIVALAAIVVLLGICPSFLTDIISRI
jgi:NADH-quinone oxidoreductase subunit N